MSRIHEALKKAARERSAPVGMVVEGPVLDFAREIGKSITTGPNAPVPGNHEAVVSNNNRNALANLNYEEFAKRCAHREWRINSHTSVFKHPNAGNAVPERFRLLRSRLYQFAASRPLRRVLVTSGVAGEGKTFVAANLAQSIVQQPERKVLLIDADLRAPRLHTVFGALRSPGLTEYLRDEADEFHVIQKGAEENLCLLCAGREVDKPSELLLGEQMKQLLERVTPLFDWIIIDSPPALPVQDASDLARLTDGVLLVLRASATHAHAAERTAAEFKGKNLLGVVLNQIRPDNSYGEYYYPKNGQRIIPAA